jgi:16S rRNA G527 N7-methylase RsmG
VKHEGWLERAASYVGLELTGEQRAKLEVFGRWLGTEGATGGAIGPNEAARIEQRHLADSLLFAFPWRQGPPPALMDVGSGVGLPGIPLAVAWPDCAVTLLDRSARRCTLARRALRILELRNVEVRQGDLESVESGGWHAATARAVSGGWQLVEEIRRVLTSEGLGVVGGSHTTPPVARSDIGVVEIPSKVLDHAVWLFIIRSS